MIDIGSRIRLIQTSHEKTKPLSDPGQTNGCTMVQNEIIELAEHVEMLLSELSNDNDYSASKSDMFFTSNEELQKKIGQTPFNARLKEEMARGTGDYMRAPGPGFGF